jgi:citrate synthase
LRAFTALGAAAAAGNPTYGRTPKILCDEAAVLVGYLASAFGAAERRDTPLHQRLAIAWRQDAGAADLIRRALVLLADQELTSSAFVARVAASTGASLEACVLAGMATLSGPLHGDATVRVRSLVEEVARTSAEQTVDRHRASGLPIPGFGHPLYPEGDPRASALLGAFDVPEGIARMIERVGSETGLQPNIDVALATLVAHCRLPNDAAFALFAISRCVGWLAHIIEQVPVGTVIRPRARYIGPMLEAFG